jgi:pimeloyl-ACP methyl ester carboxylesterase
MPSGRKRPWYSPVRLAQRTAIYVVVGYVVLCTLLYFEQDGMIYPGADGKSIAIAESQAALEGCVPWDKPTPGAASPQGYVPRDFDKPAPRGTIVVFHGNGDTAYDRNYYLDAFRQRGFRGFLYEYPGYGGRPGHPHEANIVPDARALIRELDAMGLGPIYVWGESLGSGVASSVVADSTLPVHGLALMMPFDTIANVALYRFPFIPARELMHDSYDSIDNLAHFQHPICVIRGDLDPVIPPALTLNLFAHLRDPKLMILQSGYGHGDWPVEPNLPWWDEALNFIAPPAAKK